MDNNFEKGDILRFFSFKFPPLHYAVYIGDGDIVHYNNQDGKNKNKAEIMKESLEDYKKRSPKLKQIKKVTYDSLSDTKKTPEEIRKRALEAYRGQAEYKVVIRNCEHFATWCVYGKKVSVNIRVFFTSSTVGAATVIGGGAGAIAGGAIGTMILPGIGTAVGAFIGGGGGAVTGLAGGAAVSGITTGVVHLNTEETNQFC